LSLFGSDMVGIVAKAWNVKARTARLRLQRQRTSYQFSLNNPCNPRYDW
jgi:hypothetical protein